MPNEIGSSSLTVTPAPRSNFRFVNGDTLLHIAIRSFPTDIVTNIAEKILEFEKNDPRPTLSTPLDVNAQNAEGDTPLHLAVKYQNSKMITDLLNFGADPNIPNSTGESAGVIALRNPNITPIIKSFTKWNNQTKVKLILNTIPGNTDIYQKNIKNIQNNLSKSKSYFHKLLKSSLLINDKEELISDNLITFAMHTFQNPRDLASFLDIKLNLPKEFTAEIGSISKKRKIYNTKYHEIVKKYAQISIINFDQLLSKK